MIYEIYMGVSILLGAVTAGLAATGTEIPQIIVGVTAGWLFLGGYVSRLAGKNVSYPESVDTPKE